MNSVLFSEQLLYVGDKDWSTVVEVNISAGTQRTVLQIPGVQIYAVAAGPDYVYYTAWNRT